MAAMKSRWPVKIPLMRDVLLIIASGRLGCAGIVDDAGGLIGIVTDGDVRRHWKAASRTGRPAR